jgi:hypothetical protein
MSIALKVGFAVSRGSLNYPSKMNTWCMIRLLSFSPIVISKHKKQLPHIPDARSNESVEDLGPTTSSSEFRVVRSRGTHVTNSSHIDVSLIAISRDRDQPLPIHER